MCFVLKIVKIQVLKSKDCFWKLNRNIYKFNLYSIGYRKNLIILFFIYRKKERKIWYGTSLYRGAQVNGEAGISDLERFRYNVDNTLMFNKKFNNNHRINGTVGFVLDELMFKNKAMIKETFKKAINKYEENSNSRNNTTYINV